MNDILRSAYEQHAKMKPWDRNDSFFVVHPEVLPELIRAANFPCTEGRDTLLGLPLHVDPSGPKEGVELRTESAFDASIRRARERGTAVTVIQQTPWVPELPIYIEPTLKSLLRTWGKKIRKASGL